MELSWKKYAAALTAAVCLFVPFSDSNIAGAADNGGFNWGNAGDGFIADWTPSKEARCLGGISMR